MDIHFDHRLHVCAGLDRRMHASSTVRRQGRCLRHTCHCRQNACPWRTNHNYRQCFAWRGLAGESLRISPTSFGIATAPIHAGQWPSCKYGCRGSALHKDPMFCRSRCGIQIMMLSQQNSVLEHKCPGRVFTGPHWVSPLRGGGAVGSNAA